MRPGQWCNSASVGWYEGGCGIILREWWHVAWRAKSIMLQYLRASLNGAILDTLRAYARLRKISRPVPEEPGEPHVEDVTSSSEALNILKTLLSNPREVRLACLLFHCGMGPGEIVHMCPEEFDDVREVYGLRYTILERLLCKTDKNWLATRTLE